MGPIVPIKALSLWMERWTPNECEKDSQPLSGPRGPTLPLVTSCQFCDISPPECRGVTWRKSQEELKDKPMLKKLL